MQRLAFKAQRVMTADVYFLFDQKNGDDRSSKNEFNSEKVAQVLGRYRSRLQQNIEYGHRENRIDAAGKEKVNNVAAKASRTWS